MYKLVVSVYHPASQQGCLKAMSGVQKDQLIKVA